MNKEENWKDVPNYENYYEASNLGNIRRKGKAKNLSLVIKGAGYYQVLLSIKGIRKYMLVHHIIADTFLEDKRDGRNLVVDHINNNKLDNRPENLQIVSQRINNSKDSIGTSKYPGVSYETSYNKWRSEIRINGKNKFLGRFENEEEASQSYQNELIKLKK